ncbi:MAG: bifunctional phosphoglucose/phosphomannose isomerase [Candidatus Saccharimonadales bacterium]
MLDDLVLIHQRDAQDALGIAEKQWEQLAYSFDLPRQDFKPETIVYGGMGGSALGALLATTWPGFAVPFVISRDYSIPAFTSDKTLFIASSYSGNTEETLEALGHAEESGARIVVVAAGGRLVEIAKEKNYPLLPLPQVTQPRFATLYGFKALVTILQSFGLLDTETTNVELAKTVEFLKQATDQWRPDVATKDNVAKQLALEVIGKSIVVYGGPLTYPAAYKWKISFNENAKNVAWANQYPEFNHNEFLGWTSHPLDKPYAVIDLRSNFEHPQVQKRFTVSERLLSGRRPAPHIVQAQGETILEQLVWLVALGDFVSLYTAILNGLNPTPIDLIEKFKKELV